MTPDLRAKLKTLPPGVRYHRLSPAPVQAKPLELFDAIDRLGQVMRISEQRRAFVRKQLEKR